MRGRSDLRLPLTARAGCDTVACLMPAKHARPGRKAPSRLRRVATAIVFGAWLAPVLCGAAAAQGADALSAAAAHYRAGRLTEARAAYLAILEQEPSQFTALHRLARVESDLGEDASGEEQRNLVSAAVEHARAAVAARPDSAQGHLELAVALGRQALKEGPKTRLALSREIKAEVDRTIELDPAIGRAFHVRAMWNRKLASLNFVERLAANTVLGGVPKGASMENAIRDLERAVELEPAYVNHRLELGRTYLETNRKADARRELQKAVSLAPSSSPRDARYQAEARELLKKIKD